MCGTLYKNICIMLAKVCGMLDSRIVRSLVFAWNFWMKNRKFLNCSM